MKDNLIIILVFERIIKIILTKCLYRDREKEKKRRRSRSRDRDRERKRERKERRERDRGDRLEYIKTDDGGEIRIKEEPLDGNLYEIISRIYHSFFFFLDYPEYPQYPPQPYDSSRVKYEEDEQKYEPDNANGNRHYDDDYEEGEAY